jgi:hypothetical protein
MQLTQIRLEPAMERTAVRIGSVNIWQISSASVRLVLGDVSPREATAITEAVTTTTWLFGDGRNWHAPDMGEVSLMVIDPPYVQGYVADGALHDPKVALQMGQDLFDRIKQALR